MDTRLKLPKVVAALTALSAHTISPDKLIALTDRGSNDVRIVVVSQELSLLRSLWSKSEANHWLIDRFESAREGMDRIERVDGFDLVLLDAEHAEQQALEFLHGFSKRQRSIPLVVICRVEDAKTRNEAFRHGATRVLGRPFQEHQLERTIYESITTVKDPVHTLSTDDEVFAEDDFFLTVSPVMQKVRAQAELLAQSDVPALIMGEPGTGREAVARLIHKLSMYSGHLFEQVNCAGISPQTLKSRLYARNSVHEATAMGRLEGGEPRTLLLQELSEMPLPTQSTLLEALQEKHIRALESGPATVRILATSSAELERATAENTFMEALYTRFRPFTVRVPSLRQRKGDIEVLLRYTMCKMANHHGLPSREFSRETVHGCIDYSWPGNLRQLSNFVRSYLLNGQEDLSEWEAQVASCHTPKALMTAAEEAAALGNSKMSLKSLVQQIKSQAERNAISAALEETHWNRKKAARLLRVSYRTLLYKIERYHMYDSAAANDAYPGLQQ
jgi:two-component system response regulator AtoC